MQFGKSSWQRAPSPRRRASFGTAWAAACLPKTARKTTAGRGNWLRVCSEGLGATASLVCFKAVAPARLQEVCLVSLCRRSRRGRSEGFATAPRIASLRTQARAKKSSRSKVQGRDFARTYAACRACSKLAGRCLWGSLQPCLLQCPRRPKEVLQAGSAGKLAARARRAAPPLETVLRGIPPKLPRKIGCGMAWCGAFPSVCWTGRHVLSASPPCAIQFVAQLTASVHRGRSRHLDHIPSRVWITLLAGSQSYPQLPKAAQWLA